MDQIIEWGNAILAWVGVENSQDHIMAIGAFIGAVIVILVLIFAVLRVLNRLFLNRGDAKENPDHVDDVDMQRRAMEFLMKLRNAEAEVLFRKILEVRQKRYGKLYPQYSTDLLNLAGTVSAQRRYAEAESMYRELLELHNKSGERDLTYAFLISSIAGTVVKQGRDEEAEGLYREALAINQEMTDKRDLSYAIDLRSLGELVNSQGRHAEAEELYREALAIFKVEFIEGDCRIEFAQKEYDKILQEIAKS